MGQKLLTDSFLMGLQQSLHTHTDTEERSEVIPWLTFHHLSEELVTEKGHPASSSTISISKSLELTLTLTLPFHMQPSAKIQSSVRYFHLRKTHMDHRQISVPGQDKRNKLRRQEKDPQVSDGHKMWLYDGARYKKLSFISIQCPALTPLSRLCTLLHLWCIY